MKRNLVYVLASLAFIASEAEAQHVRRIGKLGQDRSPQAIARLLERSGTNCHRLWVSKAIEDSKAVLKQGIVILDTPACEPAPPQDVAERSRRLLDPPVVTQKATPPAGKVVESLAPKVAELETQVANLRTENNALDATNTTLSCENTTLKGEKGTLEDENKTLKSRAALDDTERWRLTWKNFGLGALFAAVVLGLFWLLVSGRSSRQEQKIDVHHGHS